MRSALALHCGKCRVDCWKQAQRISVAVKDARDHARNKNATTCTNRRVAVLFFVHDRKKATKPANNKVAMAGPASRKNTCSFMHLRSALVQADKPIEE